MGRKRSGNIQRRAFAARHDEAVGVEMEFHLDIFNRQIFIAPIFLVANNVVPARSITE